MPTPQMNEMIMIVKATPYVLILIKMDLSFIDAINEISTNMIRHVYEYENSPKLISLFHSVLSEPIIAKMMG